MGLVYAPTFYSYEIEINIDLFSKCLSLNFCVDPAGTSRIGPDSVNYRDYATNGKTDHGHGSIRNPTEAASYQEDA